MSTHAPVSASGRLGVELRISGLVGFAWWLTVLHLVGWVWVATDEDTLATLPWVRILAPQVIGLVALSLVVYARTPPRRWPRRPRARPARSPLLLMLLGWPTLPLALALWIRDRRHPHAATSPGSEPNAETTTTEPALEDAYRQLVALPSAISLTFLGFTSFALVADALLLAELRGWTVVQLAGSLALSLALVAPMAALLHGRVRSMLRPELLAAPREATSIEGPRPLHPELTVPAAGAALGVVLAPALAAWAWTATASENAARHEARVVADALATAPLLGVPTVHGDASEPRAPLPLDVDDELAARVAKLTVTVEWSDAAGNHRHGPAWPPHPDEDGFFDIDGDTLVDGYQHQATWGRVVVPVVRRPAMNPVPLVLGILPAYAVVLAAIVLLTRMLSRDLQHVTGHVRTIAQGVEPTPLRTDALATQEVRELVRRLDELVGRIADANVDTYVAIEKAHEAERLKGQFLANMSHDLRSPLNSILGFSELLLTGIEGEIHPEQRELLEIIQRSGRELLQQIDEILDTAKLEAGRMELHAEPTPPATLVSRAITQARRRRPDGVDWQTTMAAGLPSVFVDPFRVAQALEHVLVFAAERVEQGTIDVQIRPRTDDRLGRFVEVHVTTPRAPAGLDELDRMRFGFVRIPGHRGLGLGLPIAGSILELTGGGLSIEPVASGDADGMRFVVQLPAPEVRRRLRLEVRPTKTH